MTNSAKSTFKQTAWDEKPYDEKKGLIKLTRARVTNNLTGDIEGDGMLEYLMAYADEKTASFVGLHRIVGRIGDKSGSFVLQHSGTFENGVAKADLAVIPGSGTGDLRGLKGKGKLVTTDQESANITLDYDFE